MTEQEIEQFYNEVEISINKTDNLYDEIMLIAIVLSKKSKKSLEDHIRRTFDVDFVFDDTININRQLDSWVRFNISLIKTKLTVQRDVLVDVMKTAITSAWSDKRLYEEIKKFTYSEKKAKTIARDQLGKLYGQIESTRQAELGVEKYIWYTARDKRVRDEDKVLDAKLCRWDDSSVFSEDNGKTWKSRSSIRGSTTVPGMAVQCRCHASAVFDDYI